jgi:N-acetylmuramoyl-L-alanine amidase
MNQVRLNIDLKYIIIHHTNDMSLGKDLNEAAIGDSQFGADYDILINPEGTVDMSPRWIFALQASQYIEDIDIRKITKYSMHHLSAASERADLNREAVHVALVGNFDIASISHVQLSKLVLVLKQLCKVYSIDEQNIQYHSDSTYTSCPGNKFLSISELKNLVKV